MRALRIGGLVAGVMLASVCASWAQIAPGERWSIPQGVTNASGQEQAYLIIVPYQGSAQSQAADVTLARDGQANPDASFTVTLSAETTLLGRRTAIAVHDRIGYRPQDMVNGQPQIWSAKVYCPTLCTVQLEQHPATPLTFWSGMKTILAIPETAPPEAK